MAFSFHMDTKNGGLEWISTEGNEFTQQEAMIVAISHGLGAIARGLESVAAQLGDVANEIRHLERAADPPA